MREPCEYKCEDCDKLLVGADLHFDDEGVPLCTVHWNYLVEETEAMSEAEYREMRMMMGYIYHDDDTG